MVGDVIPELSSARRRRHRAAPRTDAAGSRQASVAVARRCSHSWSPGVATVALLDGEEPHLRRHLRGGRGGTLGQADHPRRHGRGDPALGALVPQRPAPWRVLRAAAARGPRRRAHGRRDRPQGDPCRDPAVVGDRDSCWLATTGAPRSRQRPPSSTTSSERSRTRPRCWVWPSCSASPAPRRSRGSAGSRERPGGGTSGSAAGSRAPPRRPCLQARRVAGAQLGAGRRPGSSCAGRGVHHGHPEGRRIHLSGATRACRCPTGVGWQPLIAVAAAATMTLGNLAAALAGRRPPDPRLVGGLPDRLRADGHRRSRRVDLALPALLYFLVAYVAGNIAAFGVVVRAPGPHDAGGLRWRWPGAPGPPRLAGASASCRSSACRPSRGSWPSCSCSRSPSRSATSGWPSSPPSTRSSRSSTTSACWPRPTCGRPPAPIADPRAPGGGGYLPRDRRHRRGRRALGAVRRCIQRPTAASLTAWSDAPLARRRASLRAGAAGARRRREIPIRGAQEAHEAVLASEREQPPPITDQHALVIIHLLAAHGARQPQVARSSSRGLEWSHHRQPPFGGTISVGHVIPGEASRG